jgi:hypothetical protein
MLPASVVGERQLLTTELRPDPYQTLSERLPIGLAAPIGRSYGRLKVTI